MSTNWSVSVARRRRRGHDVRMKDWVAWHAAYDDLSSPLSFRLRCVQSHLSDAIDRAPAGRVQLVSLCAGQGRDVIGVLAHHHRRGDVHAVLVESNGATSPWPARRLLHRTCLKLRSATQTRA